MTLQERRAWAAKRRPAWTLVEAAEIAAVDPPKLRTWERTGFLRPSFDWDGDYLYALHDVVAARFAEDVNGIIPKSVIARAVREFAQPLEVDGDRVWADFAALGKRLRHWVLVPGSEDMAEACEEGVVTLVPEGKVMALFRHGSDVRAVQKGINVHVLDDEDESLLCLYWPLPLRSVELLERVETWRLRVGARRGHLGPMMVGEGAA